MQSAADILKNVKEQRVQFVALWFTDITGLVKSVMIPAADWKMYSKRLAL